MDNFEKGPIKLKLTPEFNRLFCKGQGAYKI